jgi:glycerophosphoryl diester phosphodiesterase
MKTALSCLPDGAAMMASHRGISREWDMAENSLAGLERLIADGYRVAEIDLAGTKDGTLFLYHDGVWEEKSTGTGPVAATLTADLDTILLKNRAGEVTSERPPTFAQVLETAKDRLYLEIDFKSSAPAKRESWPVSRPTCCSRLHQRPQCQASSSGWGQMPQMKLQLSH